MLEIPSDGQLAEFRSIFERSLIYVFIVGLANSAGSTFQRMANWPSFDHFSRGVYSIVGMADFAGSKFQRMANWPISILYARNSNGWPTGQFRFYMPDILTDGQLAGFDFICLKLQRMANWPVSILYARNSHGWPTGPVSIF